MSAPTSPPAAASLQRRPEAREEPGWIDAALSSPATRFLVSCGTTHLVRREPRTQIAFLSSEHALISAAERSQLLLLGWFNGQRCVLVDLPADQAPTVAGAHFEELRSVIAMLSEDEAQLLVYARALIVWRSRHRHCGVCGAPTEARSAGHVMACTRSACGAEFFPRIDPAIIVLVTDDDQALLGRQASWAQGRYSALAGFVEVGENLEQAVAREVAEETGAIVTEVHYFGSQPWPFPASLMLAFRARARRAPVQLDGELEDARWFKLDELRGAEEKALPPPYTIARRLIESWLQEHPP